MRDERILWPPMLAGERHAIRRAWERYGIRLTAEDVAHIAGVCAAKRAAPLVRHDRRHNEVRAVTHCGVRLLAVFRRYDRRILTFLPPDEVNA